MTCITYYGLWCAGIHCIPNILDRIIIYIEIPTTIYYAKTIREMRWLKRYMKVGYAVYTRPRRIPQITHSTKTYYIICTMR